MMRTPLGAVPAWAVVVANVAFWAIVHAGTGYAVHRLPARRLDHDRWLWRARRIERNGRAYERLRIRSWKDRLPESGAVFAGGTSKRHLPDRSTTGLERFVLESRRAELGHWLALVAGPVAGAWNPPPGAAAMVAYGVVVNAPFIAIQRYNRQRIQRVITRRPHPGPGGGTTGARLG